MLEQLEGALVVKQITCYGAEKGKAEKVVAMEPLEQDMVWLRVKTMAEGKCQFSYSLDGKKFREIGGGFSGARGKMDRREGWPFLSA